MYLACLLIIFTIGDVGSSGKELISNGKKYFILDQVKPEDSECKGSKSLMDEDGNIFCFKKDTEQDNSQQFQWNYGECGRENRDEARIMGGDKATPNRFPWVVVVGDWCTGAIISPRAILTAGHCAVGFPNFNIYAGSGLYYRNESLTYWLKKIIVHPKFKHEDKKSGNDIAILITNRDIEFSKSVGPICLPKIGMNMEPGTEATAIGYGAIWSLSNVLIKYKIIKAPMPKVDPSIPVDQLQMLAYNAFKDIMPYIDEIFFTNLTLKNKGLQNDEKGIEKLIKQHQYDKEQIAKQITDKQDLDHFNDMYFALINSIIGSSYDTDDDFTRMFGRMNMNMIFTTPDAPKYLKETFAEEKECPTPLSEGEVCVRSSLDGGVCMGDSGGPLAALIDQKYYIGGVLSMVMSIKNGTFPFMCRCSCPEYGPNYSVYTSVNYYMDWIFKQLVENNAQIQ